MDVVSGSHVCDFHSASTIGGDIRNHPMLVATTLSRDGKDKYKEAARKAGPIGLTVLNLDKGMPTVPWMF